MEKWRIIKPLVKAMRAMVIALGCLKLYSLFWKPPHRPIITGEKQIKKGFMFPLQLVGVLNKFS